MTDADGTKPRDDEEVPETEEDTASGGAAEEPESDIR
jgi:hypothetical protein